MNAKFRNVFFFSSSLRSLLCCWKLKLMNACEIAYMPHAVPISPHHTFTHAEFYFKILNSFISRMSISFRLLVAFIFFYFNSIRKCFLPFSPYLTPCGWVWARVHCDLQIWIIYAFIACALISFVWRSRCRQINMCGRRFMEFVIIHTHTTRRRWGFVSTMCVCVFYIKHHRNENYSPYLNQLLIAVNN